MGLIQLLNLSRFSANRGGRTGEAVVNLCTMRLIIRFDGGKLPNVSIGSRGRELSCYVPDDLTWRQIAYGQGEGAVEIDGREWQFNLWVGTGEVCVSLESGEIRLAEAEAFIRRVATKLAGRDSGFNIYLKGERSDLRIPYS
jgi:hypothetical protein